MIQGRTMTPHKSNLSIDAWLTRLGRVLAQDTGNQPVIRRVPSNASDTEKDLIWWVPVLINKELVHRISIIYA